MYGIFVYVEINKMSIHKPIIAIFETLKQNSFTSNC